MVCRRRTIFRLSSSNGTKSGVWGVGPLAKSHIAFRSLQSLKEDFFHDPGESKGAMRGERICPKSQINLGQPRITKIFACITRLCTTSQASFKIQRAGIDVLYRQRNMAHDYSTAVPASQRPTRQPRLMS